MGYSPKESHMTEQLSTHTYSFYSFLTYQVCLTSYQFLNMKYFSYQPHPNSSYSSSAASAAAAKLLQSCPILCDPIDGSPPGSPVPGILQGRTLTIF